MSTSCWRLTSTAAWWRVGCAGSTFRAGGRLAVSGSAGQVERSRRGSHPEGAEDPEHQRQAGSERDEHPVCCELPPLRRDRRLRHPSRARPSHNNSLPRKRISKRYLRGGVLHIWARSAKTGARDFSKTPAAVALWFSCEWFGKALAEHRLKPRSCPAAASVARPTSTPSWPSG